MVRNSLFLKVYLTLLASLAVVAFTSAFFVRLGQDELDRGWGGRRDKFIATMLPLTDDPAMLKITLERLADAFAADLALYNPHEQLIASAGEPFKFDAPGSRQSHDGKRPFAIRLADGRVIQARMPLGPGGRNPLGYLAVIAGVIGLAAYPVVRHLTRRLERLRRGVEIWGAGELGTRVAASGSDEVAAVARSFNIAADRIERLVDAHRSLLANASHELRSPLARLRMAIDLYERSADQATKREIVQSLSELDSLVEEILLASRLDHVQKLDHVEAVDMLALAAEEGARNDVAVSGSTAMISGDVRLLRRLVRNLMQNALCHGAPPVIAEVETDGAIVRLCVKDHGEGIPDGEGTRVFEPFYRPTGRSESKGGWGLGLSLVRQIATHHRGSVRYERVPEGGACFIVEFPASSVDPPVARPTPTSG